MVVAHRRRRRRPVLPVLAAFVAAVVVLVVLARSCSSPDRPLGWLDQVRPAVEHSNQLGLELDRLRSQISQLDRATLSRRLDRLVRESQAILDDVEHVQAPPELRAADSLLVSAMTIRARAVGDLRPAFDLTLGSAPVSEAVQRFSVLGTDLAIADRDYELFLASIPSIKEPATVPSRWVADATAWQPPALAQLVNTVRATKALAPIHDVGVVTMRTDPPAIRTEGSVEVLPATKTLEVEAVVANMGNEAESQVAVVASLSTPGPAAPETVRQVVDLGPGQRLVMRLGDLHPVADTVIALTLTVGPVSDEGNLPNNSVTRALVFRGAS